jgi:hypothetical protein
MSIDRQEADALLAEIETTISSVKRSRQFRMAGAAMILWGAIVFIAQLICADAPEYSVRTWLIADFTGVVGTIALLRYGLRERAGVKFPARYLGACALFFLFGYAWTGVIGGFGAREAAAFWPTFFFFAYSLAGLYFGWAFVAIGLVLSGLILGGYLWSGDWFSLWLAVVCGGGLVLSGVWMRQA